MATSFPGLSPNRQGESRNEVARMEVIKKKIRNRGREISEREKAKLSKVKN